jgi:hypothetical protein
MQAWLRGHRLKEARRAVQVRAVKGVVENQKSEGSRCHSRFTANAHLRGYCVDLVTGVARDAYDLKLFILSHSENTPGFNTVLAASWGPSRSPKWRRYRQIMMDFRAR